jgi:hypothetical protein
VVTHAATTTPRKIHVRCCGAHRFPVRRRGACARAPARTGSSRSVTPRQYPGGRGGIEGRGGGGAGRCDGGGLEDRRCHSGIGEATVRGGGYHGPNKDGLPLRNRMGRPVL